MQSVAIALIKLGLLATDGQNLVVIRLASSEEKPVETDLIMGLVHHHILRTFFCSCRSNDHIDLGIVSQRTLAQPQSAESE